jgi:hypothetical protein
MTIVGVGGLVSAASTVRSWRRVSARVACAGTLDDPSSVSPDVHIYTRSKLPWVTLPDGVPAVEVYYDTKALWPSASLERLRAVMAPADSDA